MQTLGTIKVKDMKIRYLTFLLLMIFSCKTNKKTPKYYSMFDLISEGLELNDKEHKKIEKELYHEFEKYKGEKNEKINQKTSDSLMNIVFQKHLSKVDYDKYKDQNNLIIDISVKAFNSDPQLDTNYINNSIQYLEEEIENKSKYYNPKILELRKKFDRELSKEDKQAIKRLRKKYHNELNLRELKYKQIIDENKGSKAAKVYEVQLLLLTEYRLFISKEHFKILSRNDKEFNETGVGLLEKYKSKLEMYQGEAYKIWKEYQEEILKQDIKELPKEKQKLYLGVMFLMRE